ncbi:MAG: RHS repeat domain-containing protein [Candidatus Acidiferrales bacterium]
MPKASPSGPLTAGPDVINLGNLNVHLAVPVIRKPGRGTPFTYDLSFDNSVWYPSSSSGTNTWAPVQNWGWLGQTAMATGYVSYVDSFGGQCSGINGGRAYDRGELSYFFYYDSYGTAHHFNGIIQYVGNQCLDPHGGSLNTTAIDGSGYNLQMTVDENGNITSYNVYSRTGTGLNPPLEEGLGTASFTDRNGNEITYDGSGHFYDTLSSTAPVLTVSGSGTPTSPTTFTYAAPSGAAFYTVKYTSQTVKTNFGCSGISEFGPTSENLVSEIDLPGGSKYMFQYEQTPNFSGDVTGRLASVTLPTGGTIDYTYAGSNNGIECTDGSTAELARETSDGTWTYSRSGSGTQWTTTIDDPQGNQTSIQFQEATGSNYFYETQRQISQLVNGTQTLLQTTNTCYNGSSSPCTSTAITLPITNIAQIVQLPGSSNLESKHVSNFNSYGTPTNSYDYDWGSGAPGSLIRQTLITYASLGNNINAFQQNVEVEDGSNHVASNISYNYDETAVAQTTGTPQHVSVSGSRGNLTSIVYTTQGSSTLKQTFTYFDTGNVDTATDVNGAQTTYNYPNATSTCGNAFPTSVTEPLSLSKSMTWNCTGGVMTSLTDENNQPTAYTWNDPYFWRTNAVTDAENNTTNLTYASPTSVESSLNFNGSSSTVDVLATLDGLGRAHINQRKQSPSASNYDSIETDYDSLGRPSKVTVPYNGTAGQTGGSTPATTTSYDALNRPLVITDGGNGTVTRSYSANDVLQTVGPAPTGENAKRKQSEYNVLGELTSVCEITGLSGSGACTQNTSATGYWTEYSYDALGHLTGVTQNAQTTGQQQTRGYTYDDLGRLTSETNPETGTINYAYDLDTTCGTSNGDLVKKTDAAGNVSCYTHDALHRVTNITYPSGPNSANTPGKHFIYDSATVNGVAMANAKTRLAEAYTCVSPCSTKITDEGFSYTARGEVSDMYESTLYSGGYYHAAASYWANGALDQLTGLGFPMTYGVDGEGRPYSVSAGSGQNPVSSTNYNMASEATQVNFGSGDSDAFGFDSNTFRMTQYQFNVNGKAVTGALTWNANRTLQSLNITDPFNAADTQNCAYSYDDLARIAGANCGAAFSGTYTYDAFGNITKSGTFLFQPGYNYQTNQMSSGASYDGIGDVTSDSLHSYAWDSFGRPTTIDSISMTYDAFGRMVEQNKGGVYTEIFYGPTGAKLALYNGSTLVQAFIPLPGGGTAIYNASGLQYYRHPDWLASSRFASTPSRTMYYDLAYAPFGEQYAQSGNTGVSDVSFAQNNEDTTTDLYDAQNREYGIQGRWPSPDPAGGGAANPANPQSWNRYAYLLNNPLSAVDTTGLFCVWDDGSYDSPDDPETGTPDGCASRGGTWFGGDPSQYGFGSDWSSQGNPTTAGFINDWTGGQGGGQSGFVEPTDYQYYQQTQSALEQAGQMASPQNIFGIWGSSLLAGACGPLWQQCTALAVAGSMFLNDIFGTGEIGPPNQHIPNEGPNGGYSGPESPPISGPPVPPGT